ncbi:MAG: hypothetical protein M1820_007665 [Bogoriella megaspora]|nr:MAG: hypothetical protein M1820_007665 [Bogoriella megaspora]
MSCTQKRAIYVFYTPAGTPSSSRKGDTRPGNHFRIPINAQHQGVLVKDNDIANSGTFFELYRPGGGIGVLTRSRSKREREELQNGKWIKYGDTGFFTTWTDDEITRCATTIRKVEMKGTYSLRNASSHTMTNLLVQRIADGPEPFLPRKALSSTFGGGKPSDRTTSDITECDKFQPGQRKRKRIFRKLFRERQQGWNAAAEPMSASVAIKSSSSENQGGR